MAEQEVKLLVKWCSPFAMRVEWALKLKGIRFQVVEQDTTKKSTLLLNSNPIYKKIPVLIHNEKPICESLVIVEYIDQTWKNATPILPLDPYEKAVARFWAKFVEEKNCHPVGLRHWDFQLEIGGKGPFVILL
ncbi:hypothetical protein EZV62_024628 [Acer yangbiense]|uniref:Glutathione S-transferase n=1 Tax=Acer yangbiense TaxID=1000413 RepID=A0A5C7GVM5_9ROSI|nr:hypothetical protein EZV62_024628 [Acer yangbiense]